MFNDLLPPNFMIVNYMYYIKHPKKVDFRYVIKLRGSFKTILWIKHSSTIFLVSHQPIKSQTRNFTAEICFAWTR